MKKVLIYICLFALLLVLTACEPKMFHYDYHELKESVVKVEYIYYDNPNAVQYNEDFAGKKYKLLPFDFEKMEIRGVLSEEKLDDFFQVISGYEIMMHWVHSDSPQGNCIRMIYDNGDFEIISEGAYTGSFYANGEVKRFVGRGVFLSDEFLSKWFDLQN